ncbi:MAG: glycosyltransferase family 4 protein [Planctomycetaceae bacterium]|nr:glycosyltransferase family 4 protein [Planctomycetaceae bacterium]
MHIALVRTEFDAARGGAERYAVNLARAWLAQGHRITVVCARHSESDARDMEVVHVSRPRLLGPFKHAWFASRAGQAARATGADAVLCLARAWPGDVLRLGDGLHRPWMSVRYPDLGSRRRALFNPRHSQLLKLERELFLPGRFARYVANSAMVKRQVVHMYGVDPARVDVIPNGVDPARFNLEARTKGQALRVQYGLGRDTRLVLFSGMDFRRKGLLEAVRGFVALVRTTKLPLAFACVGKGDDSEARALFEAEGLGSRGLWLEPSGAIEVWYGAADLFVLPTMYDPSANAVTEALACGTPVLTSQENGARQHLVDGVNGYILRDRTDAAEFSMRARSLIESPRAPEAVAAASGLITVRENASRLLAVLEQAAQERARRPQVRGFTFSAAQQQQWHATTGRAARLKLLRGWLWDSGAAVSLHELARKLQS